MDVEHINAIGNALAGLTKRCADGVTGIALADAAAIEANLGLE